MMRRVGLILQARFGSQRLPGKALADLRGKTLLGRCLSRLLLGGAGPVILATTTRAEDAMLAGVAHRLGVDVHRGDTEDVLGRYVEAALAHGLDVVVRATGDNPAVDIDAAARLARALECSQADYMCEDGLPLGAGVEIVTTRALVRAAALSDAAEDREHVTTFLKRRPDLFRIERRLAPPSLRRPELRFTVDTATDLTRMRRLFADVQGDEPPVGALIAAADACRDHEAA